MNSVNKNMEYAVKLIVGDQALSEAPEAEPEDPLGLFYLAPPLRRRRPWRGKKRKRGQKRDGSVRLRSAVPSPRSRLPPRITAVWYRRAALPCVLFISSMVHTTLHR